MTSLDKLSRAICAVSDEQLETIWAALTDVVSDMDEMVKAEDGQMVKASSLEDIREVFVNLMLDAFHECDSRGIFNDNLPI